MTFIKGQSGNPSGRPKGICDKRLKHKKMIHGRGPEIIETLIEMAMEKDLGAIKLCVERGYLLPKSDSIDLKMNIDSLNNLKDIQGVVKQVLSVALDGDLPDDQGKTISSLIKTYSDMQMNNRLELIEEKLGINTSIHNN